jgi:hypothetical protein
MYPKKELAAIYSGVIQMIPNKDLLSVLVELDSPLGKYLFKIYLGYHRKIQSYQWINDDMPCSSTHG